MKTMGGKGFLKWFAAIFAAAILCFFLAEITEQTRREHRMNRYLDMVRAAADEFSVPTALILAVIETESDFRPGAVSDAGACGLMQLMPDTFRFLSDEKLQEHLDSNTVFDPAVNIRYGSCYLAYLFERFGNWPTVLAAYNAGEGRVAEWLNDPDISPKGWIENIPFPETAAYVEKTMDAYAVYLKIYSGTP